MFLLCFCLGIVLLNCLCWNMKETKELEFSRGRVSRFRFSISVELEGSATDYRELSCEFRCSPTKTGYLFFSFALWIPFVSLNLYWNEGGL